MTLPIERTRAVMSAAKLLSSLLDPRATPSVPSIVRARASICLKHYPTTVDMEKVAKKVPDTFGWETK